MEDVQRHRRHLYNLLSLDFLQDIGPLRALRPATPVLLKDPLYSRFYRLYREFDRAFTPFDGDPFRLSLDKVWQLYEYWCFFQVVAALRSLAGDDAQFDASGFLADHADRISLAMPQARVAITGQVDVGFQRTFFYHAGDHTGAGTYSHEMRPDISIEVRDEHGQIQEIVLLDPKYRVNALSLNQAVNDMHRYKDAIVGPGLQKLVKRAFILCPGDDQGAQRYFSSDYQQACGLGAIVLKPGQADSVATLAMKLRELALPGVFEPPHASFG